MHLHSPDYQHSAIAEFEEVLKIDPNHPAALRGLGYAYLLQRDYTKAGEYFTRAVAANSNDARLLYYSALLMTQLSMTQEEKLSSRSADKTLPLMRKRLEDSIALDPAFADAYNLLAYTYISQGENEKAVRTMQRALELNPRNQQYLLNLAGMYMTLRRFDAATPILEGLTKSDQPQMAAQANESLSQIKQVRESLNQASRPKPQATRGAADEKTLGGPSATAGAAGTLAPAAVTATQPPQPNSPVRFLKGQLIRVDCSAAPAAALTLFVNSKAWTMYVRDSGHLIVIGADEFSCAWKNQKVAINFHETGDSTGEVMSLEIQ